MGGSIVFLVGGANIMALFGESYSHVPKDDGSVVSSTASPAQVVGPVVGKTNKGSAIVAGIVVLVVVGLYFGGFLKGLPWFR